MVGSSVGGSVTETADSPVTATEGLEMEMETVDGSVTATATATADSSVTATADGSVMATADGSVMATADGSVMATADGSVMATATEGSETKTEGSETEMVDSSVTATEDSSVTATEDGSVGGSVTVEDGPATAIRSSVSAEVGVTGVVTVVGRSASGEGGSTTEKGVEAADNSSDSRTVGRDVYISGGHLPQGLR